MFSLLFWFRRLGSVVVESITMTGTRCTFTPTSMARTFSPAGTLRTLTATPTACSFTPMGRNTFTPDP